jgi:hypothetical protein
MRYLYLIALLAGSVRAADVTVFMTGDATIPNIVNQGAKMQLAWIYAQLGVKMGWHDGKPPSSGRFQGSLAIRVDVTTGTPDRFHPGALAYTTPFAKGIPTIRLMYDRLQFTAALRPRLEPALLAHVLAHEIGHILEGTDAHAETGVMKARWANIDFDQMGQKPLQFAPIDVEIIEERLWLKSASEGGPFSAMASPSR